jgi:hypothetical protein
MIRDLGVVLALVVAAPGHAGADTSVSLLEYACGAVYKHEHPWAGQVVSSAVVVSDEPGCSAELPRCRQATLARGTTVLVGESRGGSSCVWARGENGEVSGIVRSDQIVRVARRKMRWEGVWKGAGNVIRVRRRGSLLDAEGDAVWHGYGDNTHVGHFMGSATAEGSALRIEDRECSACTVDLRLVGPFLVATDGRQCGGANVTFDGVYERVR